MKNLFYIFFVFAIPSFGQNSNDIKKFEIKLLTSEKTTKDNICCAIIEVYSGGKRVKTDVSDFDGISIFYLKSENIIGSEVRLKIHGPKCKIFEKIVKIEDDLDMTIDLEYGETEYTHHTQLDKMRKKLNIQPFF